MKRLLKFLIRDWWVPRFGGWPHGETGWMTYNPFRRTILDTGLTLEDAKSICLELNAVPARGRKDRPVSDQKPQTLFARKSAKIRDFIRSIRKYLELK